MTIILHKSMVHLTCCISV